MMHDQANAVAAAVFLGYEAFRGLLGGMSVFQQ
jgi:hypothetical protein